MVNSENTVMLSYNGEIYNYQEIRKTLESRGVIFRTHSDTFELWKLALLNRK
jgi:asparagine synthase (glutamine-hydrolysing)